MLEKLIEQFKKDYATEGEITHSEAGVYKLPFEGGIVMQAIELEKGALLKGDIGPKPEQNTESFLLKVMESNLFGTGTRGGVIGLQEDGKHLTLALELEDRCPYKTFKEKVEDFISVLDFWRNEALRHK